MYPNSRHEMGGLALYIDVIDGVKSLVVCNVSPDGSEAYERFAGREAAIDGSAAKVCELNNKNATLIRELFPFTGPVSHAGHKITLGLGDRLGLASAGHIRLLKDLDVFPVLAQQSMRELDLTGRTYNDVLDSATWAVFQEGYTKGYGADGDHLKTAEEVRMALDCGYTMITLDCSEHIVNIVEDVDRQYAELPEGDRAELEQAYVGKTFELNDVSISFTNEELKRVAVVYCGAVRHTADIYKNVISGCSRTIDFEMSVDETLSTTSPQAHFFVANELKRNDVRVSSLAPRFCGEFQKGIDYIGDVNEFRSEFSIHSEIARKFGYKLSVHSGSDKFSIFPVVGELTDVYHLKTAGTNWLEAVRVIARKDPGLFRELLACALDSLADAKKFYHITENTDNIPSGLSDGELPGLLDNNDARQVLHVTYGHILKQYKDRVFACLREFEDEYYDGLCVHIGKHLKGLGVIN